MVSITKPFIEGCDGLVVGLDRLELSTSPLSGVRSSHLSYRPLSKAGGAGRDRTGDLLNANQALSQLSYSPVRSGFILRNTTVVARSPRLILRRSLHYMLRGKPLRISFAITELQRFIGLRNFSRPIGRETWRQAHRIAKELN